MPFCAESVCAGHATEVGLVGGVDWLVCVFICIKAYQCSIAVEFHFFVFCNPIQY